MATLKLKPFWRWLLLLFAAALPGIAALHGPFFFADDYSMIHKNPLITGARPLWSAFYTQYFNHYAPLHNIFIWLQWQFFGAQTSAGEFIAHPLGFRAVSLLLHFGAAVGCWKMLKNLTGRDGLAYGVALIWAAHPAQSESVAWIVEQKMLLCGLFVFWSLAVYFDRSQNALKRVCLALILMIFSGLSKSHGLVIAPLIILYELIIARERLLSSLLRIAPFIAIAAAFSALALWAMRSMPLYYEPNWTVYDTALNLSGALCIYLQVALLPWTASFFHEMNRVISIGDWIFLGKLLTLIAIASACACACAARADARRLFFFGAIGWVAAIGPMLNVSPWSFPAYDRYAYMGLAFLLLALAMSIEGILLAYQQRIALSPVRLWAAAFVVIGAFGFWRGRLFANELSVANNAAIRAPNSCYGHAAVANTLIGDMNLAAREGRQINRKFLADIIALATRRAQQCWDFPEFFHSPAILLAASAEIQLKNDNLDAAENFSRAAIEEPRWARFVKARDCARLTLAEVMLRRADELINLACAEQTSIADAEHLANETLNRVAAARELLAQLQKLARPELLNDTTFWIEFLAHRRLGDISAIANRSRHLQLAQQALEAIPTSSLYYAQKKLIRQSDKQ